MCFIHCLLAIILIACVNTNFDEKLDFRLKHKDVKWPLNDQIIFKRLNDQDMFKLTQIQGHFTSLSCLYRIQFSKKRGLYTSNQDDSQ